MTFDDRIEKYFKRYKKQKRAIPVSFRKMIPDLNNSDRATHLIHTYPAKLLPHIPFFFLNNSILSSKGDKVIDSFCGSGTVLLETLLAGRTPIGADANPLARMISRTKTFRYDIDLLADLKAQIVVTIDRRKKAKIPNVVNLDYWFLPNVQWQLALLLESIENICDERYRDFFLICFSNLVKKVSLADPRVSVPVKLNPIRYPVGHELRVASYAVLNQLKSIDVVEKFSEIVDQNIRRCKKFNDLIDSEIICSVNSEDARAIINNNGRRLNSNQIQMFISSPPYSGAQKYVRASSLSLGWLGFTEPSDALRDLEKKSIGREHYLTKEFETFKKTNIKEADTLLADIYKTYPKRAHISANYLIEMRASFIEAHRLLKKGGYFVLVVGNNQICGREFNTQKYLSTLLLDLGFELKLKMIDDIRSYGLMTKRNKTASIITREWVLVFQKK